MTPQELKNSILQLAIQGKLVEQRPEEGTAEELYRQIQQEKQKLIREGKIKKEKPLPEITEEEKPFDIPESWIWVKLGEMVNICTGNKDANIGSEDGIFDFFTCAKEPIKARTFSFEGECIILPGNGANVGQSIYYNGQFEAYQRTYVLEKTNDYLFFPYLKIALDWNWAKYNADKMFGSAIQFIKLGNLSNYFFPLPPLAEQKRIVAKIEEILPLIDRYEKAWSRLEEFNKRFPDDMQKSILQMAIQGKLVEQRPEEGTGEELYQQIQAEKQKLIREGKIKKEKPLPDITEDEKPFDIPESWKWVHWGDLVNVVSARRVHQSDWRNAGIPFYRAREIARLAENGQVDNELYISEQLYSEFSQSGVPHTGDLMVTAVGTLGKTYIVQENDCFYYKDASVICLENYAHLLPEYLKYVMQSEMMMNQIRSNSGGTTVATLTMVRMNEYLIPLPPFTEQKRIVAKVEELLPLCQSLSTAH